MANLGIHVLEQATAVSIPVVADSGLPYVTGVAPIHTATKPGKINTPILCTSWDEAVQKLGFSYDWKTYPICEFIYSHFQLYGCQPVIFCNVMDPAKMKAEVNAKEYSLDDHMVRLPLAAKSDTVKVTLNTSGEAGGDSGEEDAGTSGKWMRITASTTITRRIPVWWNCWKPARPMTLNLFPSPTQRSSLIRLSWRISWKVSPTLMTA